MHECVGFFFSGDVDDGLVLDSGEYSIKILTRKRARNRLIHVGFPPFSSLN